MANTVEIIITSEVSRALKGLGGVSKSLSVVTKAAMAMGAAIGSVSGLALKLSIDFNKSMANVATLIPGNIKRIEQLKDSVQDLAIETGKSTSDLSEGLFQVVSAFGDSADAADQLGIVAKAATAGISSTTESLNLLSAVTKGYGDTSAASLTKVSDLAFMTNKLGQTTFPELAASMGRVVPLAAKLGQSQEELFAIFATLTGVTGNAAEVSTQLASIQRALIQPTTEMKKAIEALGFASGSAVVKNLGLVEGLEQLISTTDGSEESIGKLFGRAEALTAIFALTGAQSKAFEDRLISMSEASGATNEAFLEQTDGINRLGFQFSQLKQRIVVILQDIGDAMEPFVFAVTKSLNEVLDNYSFVFSNLPQITQNAIQLVRDLFVRFFSDFTFFKSFLDNFGIVLLNMIKASTKMLFEMSQIVMKVSSVIWVPLGETFSVIASNIRFGWQILVNNLADVMIKSAIAIADKLNVILPEKFEFDVAGLKGILSEIEKEVIKSPKTMEDAFEEGGATILGMFGSLKDNFSSIVDELKVSFETIKRSASGIADIPEVQEFIERTQALLDKFAEKGSEAITTGLGATEEQAENVKTVWDGVVEHIRENMITVQQIANETWDNFQRGIGDAFATAIVEGESLVDAFEAMLRSVIKSVISSLIQMAVQKMVFGQAVQEANSTEAASTVSADAAQTFSGAFASVITALPYPANIAAAPGVAAASMAAMLAGTVGAAGSGAATGAGIGFVGQADDGLTTVPRRGTFMLDQGERVVSASTNKDLKEMIDIVKDGRMGGMVIKQLNILPNSSIDEALLNKPKEFWLQVFKRGILPAMNELGSSGVTTTMKTRSGRV